MYMYYFGMYITLVGYGVCILLLSTSAIIELKLNTFDRKSSEAWGRSVAVDARELTICSAPILVPSTCSSGMAENAEDLGRH